MFKCFKSLLQLFLIYALFLLSPLEALIPTLTFPELSKPEVKELHGKTIEIRGFLYKNSQNQWILAAEPNLKTCCIGSKEKAQQQLIIEDKNGNLSNDLSSTAITLKGDFFAYDGVDHSHPVYQLHNPTLIANPVQPLFFAIFAIIIVFLTTIWMAKSFRFTSK